MSLVGAGRPVLAALARAAAARWQRRGAVAAGDSHLGHGGLAVIGEQVLGRHGARLSPLGAGSAA